MSKTVLTAQNVVALAQDSGLEIQEQSAYFKIYRDQKAIYVAKNKGALARIDLAGFDLDHPAVKTLTEEEAKAKRLGKVRGQVFPKTEDADLVLDAVRSAIERLTDGSKGFKFLASSKTSK